MNQITGTIQNIFSDRPLQEDEYRNESDNLIHCAKCKTPRQHHVVVLGKEMVVPIRCRCQQEVQDKEEAERISGSGVPSESQRLTGQVPAGIHLCQ